MQNINSAKNFTLSCLMQCLAAFRLLAKTWSLAQIRFFRNLIWIRFRRSLDSLTGLPIYLKKCYKKKLLVSLNHHLIRHLAEWLGEGLRAWGTVSIDTLRYKVFCAQGLHRLFSLQEWRLVGGRSHTWARYAHEWLSFFPPLHPLSMALVLCCFCSNPPHTQTHPQVPLFGYHTRFPPVLQ